MIHETCHQEDRFSGLEHLNGQISTDVKWLIRIGYGIFMVGLAVVAVGLASIFYAGSLWKAVEVNTVAIEKLDRRVEKIEEYLWGGRK